MVNFIFQTNQQQLPQQLEQMEQLAAAIAQENVGIACAFIQKTAAEKAVIEMDKRLAQVRHIIFTLNVPNVYVCVCVDTCITSRCRLV